MAETNAEIKTEKHVVQDTDLYLDVDCDASYANDDRIWRRRVWLDKETNGIVTTDEIFFSESGDDGFEETDSVPADIEEALGACVDCAVSGRLKPKADLAEALSVLREFLADAETMKETYRNEALCERARAVIAKNDTRARP